MTIFLILWIISIAAAGLIGFAKGRLGLGVVLGILIGFLGVIVMAFVKPSGHVGRVRGPKGPGVWPQWAADPMGRHEQRYWDGGKWTSQVRDGGVPSEDAPVR